MTTKQIKTYLSEIGYSMNTWYDLKKIPIVKLRFDSNISTDDNTLIKFNSSTENIELTFGKWVDGVFINRYKQTGNYTPDAYIKFESICGFIRSERYTSTAISSTFRYQ